MALACQACDTGTVYCVDLSIICRCANVLERWSEIYCSVGNPTMMCHKFIMYSEICIHQTAGTRWHLAAYYEAQCKKLINCDFEGCDSEINVLARTCNLFILTVPQVYKFSD